MYLWCSDCYHIWNCKWFLLFVIASLWNKNIACSKNRELWVMSAWTDHIIGFEKGKVTVLAWSNCHQRLGLCLCFRVAGGVVMPHLSTFAGSVFRVPVLLCCKAHRLSAPRGQCPFIFVKRFFLLFSHVAPSKHNTEHEQQIAIITEGIPESIVEFL